MMSRKWSLSRMMNVGMTFSWVLSAGANADRFALSDIVRDPGGRILRMNQFAASKYCEDPDNHAGVRLPTALELALFLNPHGISVTPKPQHDKVLTARGTFYYNHRTYDRPSGDAGIYWIWSSTPHPFGIGRAYTFDTASGYIAHSDYDRSYDMGAVRCVKLQ